MVLAPREERYKQRTPLQDLGKVADRHGVAILVEFKLGRPRRYDLGTYTTLGRSCDNTISLSDGAVSGHHAVIRQMPGEIFELQDLDTTNGTFVGGSRVTSYTLCEGDKITLGGVNFCFSQKVAEGTPAPVLRSKLNKPSTALHQVKMRVSEETAAVRPTWEMTASPDANFVSQDDKEGAQNLQQDYDRLLAGYQLIHAIVGEDDLDLILSRIVNSVIDLMSADRAAVLLVSPEGRLVPKVALQKRESSTEFEVSSSILNYVMENQSAVVCNDLGSDSRFSSSKSIILQSVRSAMCVPMLHDGALVGVVHLDCLLASGIFKQDSLEVVTTIANTAAYAVKTAMLKEQIRDMERQQAEAMRAMISGASHFINNPLAVIRANLSMLEEWSGTLTTFHAALEADPSQYAQQHSRLGIGFIDEELAPMTSETAHSAGRIEAIVRALHTFEHQQDPEAWSDFDVAELLEEVLLQHEAEIIAVARAHRQLSPAPVRGVRDRLRVLFSNLLTNAWQAIEQGAPQDHWIVASCHVSGTRVLITIDDTGRGVPEANRHRIFAPFDTDRLDGSLGLGLAVAAEIARQHKARIVVKDREGGGTRLLLDMPLAA